MNTASTLRIIRIVLTVLSVVCVFSVIYHMYNQEYETETAIFATASESVYFSGVYVRDETVQNYNGATGAISYDVSDGGKLGVGSVIAEVYADESQIDIRQQIATLEAELALLEKIQNPGTSESAQPTNLSSLIEERYKSLIYNREKGDYASFQTDKEQLLIFLSTYQEITSDDVDFSARITSLTAQISALSARQTLPLDTIVSDRSAYFASYVDGYESTLTLASVDTISLETLKSVTDDGALMDTSAIGKLIGGYKWYILGVVDNSKSMFTIGETVTLKFETTSTTVTGVIENIRATDDPKQSIVSVACDTLTSDLVQHRVERVEMIKGYYEGIKVPREAIRFKEIEETIVDEETGIETTQTINAKGVYVLLGEQLLFRRLDVIYEGSDYVLSNLNVSEDYVTLYDDIIVSGVSADGS